ncbi:MAG: hypothetical protein AAF600_14820 [Bacteroidota bacterium]
MKQLGPSFAPFSKQDYLQLENDLPRRIKESIEEKSKEYILNVSDKDYTQYLFNKFKYDPLIIHENSLSYGVPEKTQSNSYFFTITYQYEGTKDLFTIIPPERTISTRGVIAIQLGLRDNIVGFSFTMDKKDPVEFKRLLNQGFKEAFKNVPKVNEFAKNWNEKLSVLINKEFERVKEEYILENEFFREIEVPVNEDTANIFEVPTIEKIEVPVIIEKEGFNAYPTMRKQMYEDVLKVIYNAGKSMERKPSLYKHFDKKSGEFIFKKEEDLRDLFLFLLETRYKGTTATGETFNYSGKTDIILKYSEDGTNLFVAECKNWTGPSDFHGAINQLFDRYLTVRDSKVALVIFVQNKDFNNILEVVKNETPKHNYFKKFLGNRADSSFSNIFTFDDNPGHEVYFEVMLFHFK